MYNLSITVGHFDDESGDVLASFNSLYGNDPQIDSHEPSIIEGDHISGTLNFILTPRKYESIVGQIEVIIGGYSLEGECFTLTDNLGNIIATEEDSL